MFGFGKEKKAKEALEGILKPGYTGDWRRVLSQHKAFVDSAYVRSALDRGIAEVKRSRYMDAARILRITAAASLETKDMSMRALAHRWWAIALIRKIPATPPDLGVTVRDSIAALDVALTCYQSMGKAQVLAQLWRDKAVAYQAAGLNDEAVEAYDETLKLLDRNGLPSDEPGLLTQCTNGRAGAVAAARTKEQTSKVLMKKASELKMAKGETSPLVNELEAARRLRNKGSVKEAVRILRAAFEREAEASRDVATAIKTELADALYELSRRPTKEQLVLKAEASALIDQLSEMTPQKITPSGNASADAIHICESLRATDPEIQWDPTAVDKVLQAGPEIEPSVAAVIDELEAKMTRQTPTEDSVVLDAARAAQLTMHAWSRLEASDEPSEIALDSARTLAESVMCDPTKPETWAGYAEAIMLAAELPDGRCAPRATLRALPHALLAVRLGPWSQVAHYVLGKAYVRLRMYEPARFEIEALEGFAQLAFLTLQLRIDWSEAQGMRKEAIRLREQILTKAPNPGIRRLQLLKLARELAEVGELGRAEQAFQSLTRDFADYAPGWHAYSQMLQGAGRAQDALKMSDQAVSLGSAEAKPFNEQLRQQIGV